MVTVWMQYFSLPSKTQAKKVRSFHSIFKLKRQNLYFDNSCDLKFVGMYPFCLLRYCKPGGLIAEAVFHDQVMYILFFKSDSLLIPRFVLYQGS